MKIFRCTTLFFFFAFSINAISFAQSEVDSAYIEYVNNSWDEIREIEDDNAIQTKYASEFYEYYLDHKNTEAGKKAIQSALMMWGNTGNADMMDKAITTITYDSDTWSWVPNSLGNAYARDSSRTYQQAMDKLESLKDKVTNSGGKSNILTSLVRVYKRNPDTHEKALKYAQELVNINESEWYVDLGLGAIYELESLGIGQKAPEFTASTYQGGEFNLTDHAG